MAFVLVIRINKSSLANSTLIKPSSLLKSYFMKIIFFFLLFFFLLCDVRLKLFGGPRMKNIDFSLITQDFL